MIIPYYSHDCALCSCSATHSLHGIPCIEVERVDEIDRCVRCGTRWTAREYRDEPATIVSEAAA